MSGTAETWAKFQATPQTLGPTSGARQQWHKGRARYAVWILRVRSEAVLMRWQQVRESLSDRLVPQEPADLHVTLWVAGFPAQVTTHDDDVAEKALRRQSELLSRLEGPIRISVGPANAFLSCAFLEVEDPCGDIARARSLLAAGGASEQRFAPYLPHVTVGSFRKSEPTAPLVALLSAFRDAPPISLGLRDVELVEFDTHVAGSALQTRRQIHLTEAA